MTSPDEGVTRRRALCALVGSGLVCLPSGGAAHATLPGRTAARRSADPSGPQATPEAPSGAAGASRLWLQLPPTPSLPTPFESGLIGVNGTDVFYALYGEGPPVLLLHGGMAHSDIWGHQIDALAKRHVVLAMDTRGHGRSRSSDTFSYKLFAQDALALMSALHIEQAAVVGWSDGAVTALEMAMTAPARVSRVFAFGANANPQGYKPNGSKAAVFSAFVQRCEQDYARLSPTPGKWPQLVRGLRGMWRSQPNFTPAQLGAIRAPVTISMGEHDEIIRRDHTEMVARSIAGAKLVIQPGVSHFAMLQNPAQFNAALDGFLAGGR
jgi:pimeloyl-ACP methyl ester carboxylesterase